MEKYCRNSEIIEGAMDESLVMMDIDKGRYYGLNPVGKRIWEIIEEPKSLGEITDILQTEFEVNSVQCEAEVVEFIEKMAKSNVIILK